MDVSTYDHYWGFMEGREKLRGVGFVTPFLGDFNFQTVFILSPARLLRVKRKGQVKKKKKKSPKIDKVDIV